MNKKRYYVQPLGFLRGCSVLEDKYPKLAGSDLSFSAVKIIERTVQDITSKVLSIAEFENYIESFPDADADLLRDIMKNITSSRAAITFSDNGFLNWDKPVLQGILNVTPDSFSDGGAFDKYEKALSHAQEMVDFGAMIIDVGGETTKPGAKPVPFEVEKQRVLPVIERLSNQKMLVSIDSRNAGIMSEAIAAGAQIINDVSALEHDPKSIDVLKETGVPIILMHAQGNPDVMQNNPEYGNVVLDIYDYLKERINFCVRSGISKDKIIVDPGIGFGKTVDHNLEILANIAIFHGLGVPILIGVSRKSFIGKITGEEVASKRISGSIAAAQYSIDHGVQIIRIHDVEETGNALKVHNAICEKVT